MILSSLSRIEKKIEEITGLSTIDIIYIVDLVAILFDTNRFFVSHNQLKWGNFDVGNLLCTLGISIYSRRMPILICIVIYLAIIFILFLFDKTNIFNFLPKETEYTDNTVGGYNPVLAIKRLAKIMWFIYHDMWIIFLTVMILTNNLQAYLSMQGNKVNYYLLLILNFTYLLFLLIKRLFQYRIPRYLHHKKIDDISNETHYLIINRFEFKGIHYYFVKDLLLDNPLFYFAKEVSLDSTNKITIIVNSSRNFEEIKYEFNAEMNSRGLDHMSKLTNELAILLKHNDNFS